MTQAPLFAARAVKGAPSPLQRARAQRDQVLDALVKANGPVFRAKASAYILTVLAQYATGQTSEYLTLACRQVGIVPPSGDDRAFGPIYAALAREGAIVQVGWCARARGNHTGGGRVWALRSGGGE